MVEILHFIFLQKPSKLTQQCKYASEDDSYVCKESMRQAFASFNVLY